MAILAAIIPYRVGVINYNVEIAITGGVVGDICG
jgi:hypothetical protein